eukprot:COSAG01_NODE_698_length_14177_cov_13.550039_12_plen_215_part_00
MRLVDQLVLSAVASELGDELCPILSPLPPDDLCQRRLPLRLQCLRPQRGVQLLLQTRAKRSELRPASSSSKANRRSAAVQSAPPSERQDLESVGESQSVLVMIISHRKARSPGAGGDDGIDHNKNWLRFPYDSTFWRSPYLPPHPPSRPPGAWSMPSHLGSLKKLGSGTRALQVRAGAVARPLRAQHAGKLVEVHTAALKATPPPPCPHRRQTW